MKHNGKIDVAYGLSRRSVTWKNKKILWSDFVEKLSEDHKTTETYNEYMRANKEEQSKIKDVGGYVGGYLYKGRRKPENVVHRQLVTLDIDFAHIDFWEDFCMQYDNAAVLHSTHKHHPDNPRFRLIFPLSREVSPDEYVAISRRIAGYLDIELFDNTTFETNRLMYWPSTPKDVEYYFKSQDGPWFDADEILKSYIDWTDSSLWPTSDKSAQDVKNFAEKQADPEEKKGIVGAFCRTYSISEVIDKYLSDIYTTTDQDDRYTYAKGTAAAGLIVYDDKFAYSHHGTDPCGGHLCNSFDLVRLHKFGHLDAPGTSSKSFKSMEDLATSDKDVRRIIAREVVQNAKYDFVDDAPAELEEADSSEWMQDLEVDGKGKYLSNAVNLNLIFANDIRLKEAFKNNDFDGKKYVCKNLPWRKVPQPEPIKNVDYSGVRNYIESIYGIAGNLKIDDALVLEFDRNSFHPVKEYLKGLSWDGLPRIDYLLTELFGAEDTIYSREAIRKVLVGAVSRILNPGCKFDLVITLVSKQQGTGKSSFWRALGRRWFSDSFTGVSGKEAFEQLQGVWIMEMAELKGLRKSDIESVKHFISKQEDMFRPAYGRVPEIYKRQCVFVATTNENEFLRDPSGNRRFLPVDIHNVKFLDNEKLMEFIDSDEEIDQVWAEAVERYKSGETSYLSSQAEKVAEFEQRNHSEADERRGMIEDYINRGLPRDWEHRNIYERRDYFNDPLSNGPVVREVVCVAEVWTECLGKDKEDMDRYKTRELNDILKSLEDWEQSKSTKNFTHYGKQKYYLRTTLR